MKKLLLVLSLLLSSLVHSQDSSKLTVKQVYEDAKDGITKVVQQLGGPAKHVHHVYVYQHRAEGITGLAISILSVLIFSIAAVKIYRTGDKVVVREKIEWIDNVGFIIAIVICTIIAMIATIALLCSFSGDLNRIINPEYYAIQDIIKAFK